MTSYVTDGTVGPWAAEKLECLRKYLHAYTTILRKQEWCEKFVYIDAFAGAGRAKLRSYDAQDASKSSLFDAHDILDESDVFEQYINGSPRVALDLLHPFSEYIFVEKSDERVQQLNKLREDYGQGRTIRILSGDANEQLIEQLKMYDWKKCRAVAFLDPFGMQVPWDTLETLGRTNSIELILNLPIGMAVQRLLPKHGEFSADKREWLNRYFGSTDWFKVVYNEQIGLFGPETLKNSDAGQKLALWYMERLKSAYGFATRPRLIKNTRGAHLYYLMWAGPKKSGAKIASDVLRQGVVI